MTSASPETLHNLSDRLDRGDIEQLLDQLDPNEIVEHLKKLDGQVKAAKVLLKAANARRRWDRYGKAVPA